ncbi:MAG: hypothetical protein Q7R81_01650 [Candidatus Peregrinibacteria bacterium]|nr:hypothetical protein [Candidatus Peregrinibacteria bacterium]
MAKLTHEILAREVRLSEAEHVPVEAKQPLHKEIAEIRANSRKAARLPRGGERFKVVDAIRQKLNEVDAAIDVLMEVHKPTKKGMRGIDFISPDLFPAPGEEDSPLLPDADDEDTLSPEVLAELEREFGDSEEDD